jgi:4-hydroxybenzoate polyprenyltransferase
MNLVIVIITMFVVRYAVMSEIMDKSSIGMKFTISFVEFLGLIFVVTAVTAAGNTINDYFDQKVDKINKPDRVVVGRKVKRRVAIVLHQSLNVLALIVSGLVCYSTQNFWPLIIPVVAIFLLWWYSPVLKKRVLLGNFTVALCTACVPLWAAVFEVEGLKRAYSDMLVLPNEFFNQMWLWIIALCFFAFILTLIREAIKDMEDMTGDKEGDYKTLPIVHGEQRTRRYVFILITIYLMAAVAGMSRLLNKKDLILFALCILIPAIYGVISLYKASDARGYKRASQFVKFMMAGGLIFLILVF